MDNFKLFVDLDGVLCDFNKDFANKFGKGSPRNVLDKYGESMIISLIESAGLTFWSRMSWLPKSRLLWEFLKDYNPTILSDPKKFFFSQAGKSLWVSRELGKRYCKSAILMEHKYKYAKSGYVLIDDYDKNIKRWEANGGIGILYEDNITTIRKIIDIMGVK
jgi:hypothetical protein